MSDLCTAIAAPTGARERILAWLAGGAREVSWALCSVPRERWAAPPPPRLSEWPMLRHAQHLALRESHVTLPTVRHALGEASELPSSTSELDDDDASWNADAAIETAEAIVLGLGDTRFELLQCLEAAPDAAWERPLPSAVAPDPSDRANPVQLGWWLLNAHQHELEHLAAIWRVALYWDRVSPNHVARECVEQRAAGFAPIPCRQT